MARAKKTSAENVVQAAAESVKAAGELVAEEVKETVEKVISEDAAKSVAEVADKTKKAARKVKKAASDAVPEEVKKTVKKAAKKAAETTEKAAKEVKSVLVPKLEIQTNGKSINAEDIIERCKAKYGKKKVITTLEVYVNIDESKAYYVVNGKGGSDDYIDL